MKKNIKLFKLFLNNAGLLCFKSIFAVFCHLVALDTRILGDLGAVLEPLNLGRRHAVDLALEHRLKKSR